MGRLAVLPDGEFLAFYAPSLHFLHHKELTAIFRIAHASLLGLHVRFSFDVPFPSLSSHLFLVHLALR